MLALAVYTSSSSLRHKTVSFAVRILIPFCCRNGWSSKVDWCIRQFDGTLDGLDSLFWMRLTRLLYISPAVNLECTSVQYSTCDTVIWNDIAIITSYELLECPRVKGRRDSNEHKHTRNSRNDYCSPTHASCSTLVIQCYSACITPNT